MTTTKSPPPLVVCCIAPAGDESLQLCKDWVKEQGFTNETHRIMQGATCVWVEEK